MSIPNINAFEDWEGQSARCECSWTGSLTDALFDLDTETIALITCPLCHAHLATMTTFATIEQIRQLAETGSQKAIAYLRRGER
jgi:hypothetical protein